MRTPIRHETLPDAGAVPHTLLDLRPPALWHRLRTTTLTAASSTIALIALPAGYVRWRLQVLARSSASAEGDAWTLTLNSDTDAHYDIVTDTGGFSLTKALAQSNLNVGLAEGANARANCAGWADIDFFQPYDATYEKTGRFASGRMGNRSATADQLYRHGMWAWRSTGPITQLTLTMTAGDFAAGSSAALWGLRSAQG